MFFSIIIPLFNKVECISSTIESIFLQEFEDYEVVIVDDGSTDDSLLVAKEYVSDNVFIYSQRNQGVSKARNEAIKYAKGQYIVFLDADDTFLPGHLGNLYNLIIRHPENCLFSTGHFIQENNVTSKAPTSLDNSFQGVVFDPFSVLSQGLSLLNSSTTCVQREKLILPYLFPEDETRGEDLHLWIRLINKYGICHIAAESVVINRDSGCRSAHLTLKTIPAHFKVILDMFEAGEVNKSNMRSLKRFYLRSAIATAAYNKLYGDTTYLRLIIKTTYKNAWYLETFLLSMIYMVPNKLFRKLKEIRQGSEE